MFEIEKNVPIPKRRGVGGKRKCPFAQMEVGDSFEVEDVNVKTFRVVVYRNSRSLGFKFTLRKTSKGLRVWRIE